MSPTEKAILVYVLIAIVVSLLSWGLWSLSMWRYDERNPYRRYCKYCGQRQDFFEPGGWEDMGTDHVERHGRQRPA